MSHLIYTTIMALSGIIGLVLYPILRLFGYHHSGWLRHRLWPQPLKSQPQLWIHAVSVGEIKIALAVLEAMPAKCHEGLLFTTTTPAGTAYLSQNLPEGAEGHILPWDVNWALRRLFKGKRVPTLILVETEIWPRLFEFVKKEGARLFIINARLSSKTMRFKSLGVLRHAVERIDRVAARSQGDAIRFGQLGLARERLIVTGNIKFDFRSTALQDNALKSWLEEGAPTVIFASMASEEARLLAAEVLALLEWQPLLRVLWAPRQVHEVQRHLEALDAGGPRRRTDGAPYDSRLLVLDSLGELSACFKYAAVSLVGGSFNARGGQNFLESLQVGTPALVGPSCENFRDEVHEALSARAILQLAEPNQVADTIQTLLGDERRRVAMATAGKAFLENHTGAVARTVRVLLDSLEISDSEAI